MPKLILKENASIGVNETILAKSNSNITYPDWELLSGITPTIASKSILASTNAYGHMANLELLKINKLT